jgi:hypothetical protein
MGRYICFLLAIPLAFLVSPPLCAQLGGGGHGGGQFSSGAFSGHSVGHSVGQSFGHMFGHHPGRDSSQFEKGRRSRGGKLPPLAGAAFIHGKVVKLPGPGSSTVLDGHRRRTVHGQFIAVFTPSMPFGANQFDVGFCDSFRFTWRGFLFPDRFDCFANPLLSHRLFSRTFHEHFWSDSLFVGVALGTTYESVESQAASDPSGLASRNVPSASFQDAESSSPSIVKAEQPDTLLQLRDGSMYGLARYWVDGDRLHYVTDYGGENSVPLERIDFAKTAQLNASRGAPINRIEKRPNR